MENRSARFANHPLRDQYAQTVLVLQGGGALGAYQGGVYQALTEGGFEPTGFPVSRSVR
jgi:predicted acylesterase/phospholipase RssA